MFANRFNRRWVILSTVLLAMYLGFFHYCMGASYFTCIAAGVVTWMVWTGLCWSVRGVFMNRFEYGIHQLVGVDILLEGFNPMHQGFGFYYCAASFWLVFLVYQFFGTRENKATVLVAETADAGWPQAIQ